MATFHVPGDLIQSTFDSLVSWVAVSFAVVTVRRGFVNSFGRFDRSHAHASLIKDE
jgi:hypothetical protein